MLIQYHQMLVFISSVIISLNFPIVRQSQHEDEDKILSKPFLMKR